jgi:hypothetical protein
MFFPQQIDGLLAAIHVAAPFNHSLALEAACDEKLVWGYAGKATPKAPMLLCVPLTVPPGAAISWHRDIVCWFHGKPARPVSRGLVRR